MKYIVFILLILTSFTVRSEIKDRVILDVPTVEQGKMLCGPATLEMVFRYWGEKRYSQYDIAKSILHQFSNSKRYKASGIFNNHPVDWSKYPGTGTINMREFLKRFGVVKNIMLENPPKSKRQSSRLFETVKESVSGGAPVIVHQYWGKKGSRGHYRIVTGYDNAKELVYLNDANKGVRITQTYQQFMEKWNFDQRWLHYNAIIFKPYSRPLNARI